MIKAKGTQVLLKRGCIGPAEAPIRPAGIEKKHGTQLLRQKRRQQCILRPDKQGAKADQEHLYYWNRRMDADVRNLQSRNHHRNPLASECGRRRRSVRSKTWENAGFLLKYPAETRQKQRMRACRRIGAAETFRFVKSRSGVSGAWACTVRRRIGAVGSPHSAWNFRPAQDQRPRRLAVLFDKPICWSSLRPAYARHKKRGCQSGKQPAPNEPSSLLHRKNSLQGGGWQTQRKKPTSVGTDAFRTLITSKTPTGGAIRRQNS